ncbi:MAG: hypothetical protein ACO3B4_05300 [Burkholderiaceae bacterium]
MVVLDVAPAVRMIFVNTAHVYFFLEFAVQAVRVSRTTGRSGALLLAVMGLTWSQGLAPHGALVEVVFPLFEPARSSAPKQS